MAFCLSCKKGHSLKWKFVKMPQKGTKAERESMAAIDFVASILHPAYMCMA
jgi:hypothetical protein